MRRHLLAFYKVAKQRDNVPLNSITLSMLQNYRRSQQEHFSLIEINNGIVIFNSYSASIQESIK